MMWSCWQACPEERPVVLQAGGIETRPSRPPEPHLNRPSSSLSRSAWTSARPEPRTGSRKQHHTRPGWMGVLPATPHFGAVGRSAEACNTPWRSCRRGPWVSVLSTALAHWWGRPRPEPPGRPVLPRRCREPLVQGPGQSPAGSLQLAPWAQDTRQPPCPPGRPSAARCAHGALAWAGATAGLPGSPTAQRSASGTGGRLRSQRLASQSSPPGPCTFEASVSD